MLTHALVLWIALVGAITDSQSAANRFNQELSPRFERAKANNNKSATLALAEQMRKLAKASLPNSPSYHAHAHYCLATAHYINEQPLLALEHVDQALLFTAQERKDSYQAHRYCAIGSLECDLGRTDTADDHYRIAEKIFRDLRDQEGLAIVLNNRASLFDEKGNLARAVEMSRESLSIRLRLHGSESIETAIEQNNLALSLRKQGQYREAAKLMKSASEIRNRKLSSGDYHRIMTMRDLINIYLDLGNLDAADKAFRQLKESTRRVRLSKELQSELASVGSHIAADRGDPAEGELLARKALKLANGTPDEPDRAGVLASILIDMRKLGEAEELLKHTIELFEKRGEGESSPVATAHFNLANALRLQQLYAEALDHAREAQRIRHAKNGAHHPSSLNTESLIISLLINQGRNEEAESLARETITTCRRSLPASHATSVGVIHQAAILAGRRGDFAASEALLESALAAIEGVSGRSTQRAEMQAHLAEALFSLGRVPEARVAAQAAVQGLRKLERNDAAEVVPMLLLARASWELGEKDAAIEEITEAVQLLGEHGSFRARLHQALSLRAAFHRVNGDDDAARADLEDALAIAEDLQTQASGVASQRLEMFAQFASAYESMVQLYIADGQFEEAYSVMEQSRSRALRQQLQTQHVDPLSLLPDEKRAAFAERRKELVEKQAVLQRRVEISQVSRRLALARELQQVRKEWVALEAEVYNASPAYQKLAMEKDETAELGDLWELCDSRNAVMVQYFIGVEKSWAVLVLPGKGPAWISLAVSEEQSTPLGIQPGPLTRVKLRRVLTASSGFQLWSKLARPPGRGKVDNRLETIAPQLMALCDVLLPTDLRDDIQAGDVDRLFVIPDDLLCAFPFAALMLEDAPTDNSFLGDAVPAIHISASGTLLARLSQLAENMSGGVLSMAPDYNSLGASVGKRSATGVYVVSELSPLKYAEEEAKQLTATFRKQGIEVTPFGGRGATEAAFAKNCTGKRLLHFACHGASEAAHANTFGFLALGPSGNGTRLSEDGFLSASEIVSYDLKGCGVAILSACQTNLGPYQSGEGAWNLARSFFVAGARSVIATQWSVDDQATAELMMAMAEDIAEDWKSENRGDYARYLARAQRGVRENPEHPEWRHPYYWAAFTHNGP